MFNAYQNALIGPDAAFDWFILFSGIALAILQMIGIYFSYQGKYRLVVQELEKTQTFCLILIELLPVLGLLGTVAALMNTFQSFKGGDNQNLSNVIMTFAPALSATISGLIMTLVNLPLNGLLYLLISNKRKKD